MPEALENRGSKPPCRREDALAVLKRLREAGHEAYFAGGCVRDVLLGLQPKDWDIATNAPPKRVRELFRNTQAVGAAFGVILVRQGKSVVEVATFRTDEKYLDGRRPSAVRFTTAEEDAQRRDFTINGLFLDPLENDRVIDFVGGRDDLKHRRLRAIGDPAKRFAEDHLRLLRAVRFAARFNLSIEAGTAAAISRDVPLIKRISPERVGEELRLMLTAPTREIAWKLLWDFGLIDVIFRFLPTRPGMKYDAHRAIFPKVKSVSKPDAIPFGLALAAAVLCLKHQESPTDDLRTILVKPASRHAVKAMRQALKISNDESDQMHDALEGLAPLLGDDEPRVATMKRFLARPTSALSRALLSAMKRVGVQVDRIEWLEGQLGVLEKTEVAPAPLITGDDLTAAGLRPGPAFKRILEAVYDAQLEGRVNDRESALRMAMGMAGEK